MPRIYVLATAERIFHPPMFARILDDLGEAVVGAAILPGAPGETSVAAFLGRLARLDGPAFPLRAARRAAQIAWRRFALGREHLVAVERIFQRRGIPPDRFPSVDDPRLCDRVASLETDVVFNCQPGILRPALLNAPRLGCLNLHTSALPRYRGLEPVFHALLAGERSIGVSIHLMNQGLDAGPVYAQTTIPASNSVFDCYLRAFERAPGLLREALTNLENGRPAPMNDQEARRYFKAPTPEEVRLFRRKGLRYL